MAKIFTEIGRKIRSGFRLIKNIPFVWINQNWTSNYAAAKFIFNLKNPAITKDYIPIVYAVGRERTGTLVLKFSLKVYASLTGAELALLKSVSYRIYSSWRPIPAQADLLTDNAEKISGLSTCKIEPYPHKSERIKATQIQITIHPSLLPVEAALLKNSKSKFNNLARVFFSGNTHKVMYDNRSMAKAYGVPTRIQIISHLIALRDRSRLPIVILETPDHVSNFFGGKYSESVVIANWQWAPDFSSNMFARINGQDWIDVLRAIDYFIVCPGIRTPDCHNIPESLLAGATPIVPKSAHWQNIFFHQENSLIYNDLGGLEFLLKTALEGSKPNRAIAYRTYLENFSLSSIKNCVDEVKKSGGGVINIYQEVYVPWIE
jgi:hypothetical protein